MAISQSKQPTMTTPETVYDRSPAPQSNGTNSGKNGLSAGAITGLAIGGVVVCALSFVVGMQVGGGQNSMNNQAGGPPGMSRGQNGQQGGPGGQTGAAPSANQSQTSQTAPPQGQANDSTTQNTQTAPSRQTDAAQSPSSNTAPSAN